MIDHSELAKALAQAADIAKKTSALIDDALSKLSALKAALDETHPKLAGIHQAIIAPGADLPAPQEKPIEEPPKEKQSQPEHGKGKN